MWAGMPRRRAASASAWAWLPEEWVATPRRASASDSENTALAAPRNLKAPTFWKFSHLKNSSAPTRAERLAQVRTGVRWAKGRMRSAARSIAARSGASEGRGGSFMLGPILPHRGCR